VIDLKFSYPARVDLLSFWMQLAEKGIGLGVYMYTTKSYNLTANSRHFFRLWLAKKFVKLIS